MKSWFCAAAVLAATASISPCYAQQAPATVAQLLAVCRDQSAQACRGPILDAGFGSDFGGCTLPESERLVAQVVAWLAQHPDEQTKSAGAGIEDAFVSLYNCRS